MQLARFWPAGANDQGHRYHQKFELLLHRFGLKVLKVSLNALCVSHDILINVQK
jgi:hypothetical protein